MERKINIDVLDKAFDGLQPKSIFEVGFSGGALLKELGDFYGDIHLGGIERNEKDIQSAKSSLEKWNPDLFMGDARSIRWPIKEKTYDIAFTLGTLMYIDTPLQVIQEMLRIAEEVILIEPIFTESGTIHDTKTGLPFDGYGSRYNHDYLLMLSRAGVIPKVTFCKDKIIYTI